MLFGADACAAPCQISQVQRDGLDMANGWHEPKHDGRSNLWVFPGTQQYVPGP